MLKIPRRASKSYQPDYRHRSSLKFAWVRWKALIIPAQNQVLQPRFRIAEIRTMMTSSMSTITRQMSLILHPTMTCHNMTEMIAWVWMIRPHRQISLPIICILCKIILDKTIYVLISMIWAVELYQITRQWCMWQICEVLVNVFEYRIWSNNVS